MTKDTTHPETTSQDYDRKHGQNHIAMNPRAAKDAVGGENEESAGSGYATRMQKPASGR